MAGDPEAELAAIEDMVLDWEHQGQERLARVKEVTDRMGALSATAKSADDAVSVTVDAKGLPTDITLTEAAKDKPMTEVSASIMAALRNAQAQIPAQMTRLADDLGLGGDTVIAHLLRTAEESFPAPVPDEPARRQPPPDDEDFSDRDPLGEDR